MIPACDFIINNLADNCQLSTANGPHLCAASKHFIDKI